MQALTTGGIPGFVDVVLNFGSSSLQEDNLVTQMKRNRRRIVFYGDDTWLQLFPEHFDRSDGTTSFFVTDYTEVIPVLPNFKIDCSQIFKMMKI